MESPTKDKLINSLEIPCILDSPGSMAHLAKAASKFKPKTKRKDDFWIFKKTAQADGSVEIMREFLEENEEEVVPIQNQKNENGQNLLHFCAMHGFTEMVVYLIAKNFGVNDQTNDGSTPLHYASKGNHAGHAKIVQVLLEYGGDPSMQNKQGMTPLMIASKGGSLVLFEAILKHRRTNIHAANHLGETALHLAASKGKTAYFQALLKHGANIYTPVSTGLLMVHYAAKGGSVPILKILLEEGVDILSTTNNKQNALHFSCLKNRVEAAKFLIASGIDIHAKNKWGETSFFLGVREQHLDIVEYFVRNIKENDINTADYRGLTPLMFACSKGNEKLVKILLENGGDFNAVDKDGDTAIHIASFFGHRQVVQLLIQEGASLQTPNYKGKTAQQHLENLPPVSEAKVEVPRARKKIPIEIINLEGDDVPATIVSSNKPIEKENHLPTETNSIIQHSQQDDSNTINWLIGGGSVITLVFLSVAFLLWTKVRK